MIFSFLRKKKQKDVDVVIPNEYKFATCCKKCGSVIWGDSREGYYWRTCNYCRRKGKK